MIDDAIDAGARAFNEGESRYRVEVLGQQPLPGYPVEVLPKDGETWTDGRGTDVKIHYSAAPRSDFVGRVFYIRATGPGFGRMAPKSTSMSWPAFRKRYKKKEAAK